MEVRLVQLLGSFITTTSSYVLARLEYALKHPERPAPPLIARLADASETTLRTQWETVERQLDCARRYLQAQDDSRGKRAAYDPSFAHLQRTTRELEQYARAVRWVMTVDEGR
jgi:hypothetical protein